MPCTDHAVYRTLIINLEARLAFVEFALKDTLEVAIEEWQPIPPRWGPIPPRVPSPEF